MKKNFNQLIPTSSIFTDIDSQRFSNIQNKSKDAITSIYLVYQLGYFTFQIIHTIAFDKEVIKLIISGCKLYRSLLVERKFNKYAEPFFLAALSSSKQ